MNLSMLLEKLHELTDVELAILTSLVAGQHCLIWTEGEVLSELEEELELVRSTTTMPASRPLRKYTDFRQCLQALPCSGSLSTIHIA